MKTLEEYTYYEMLEVGLNASPFEIRQAYKMALSIYADDSPATYSFFSSNKRKKILKKFEQAYHTLTDEDKRADYNRELINEGKIDAASIEKKDQKKAISLFHPKTVKEKNAFFQQIQDKINKKKDDE